MGAHLSMAWMARLCIGFTSWRPLPLLFSSCLALIGVATGMHSTLFVTLPLANPCEPVDPLPQLLQLAQCSLRPATPVKQRIDMLHDLAQFAQLRQATGDVHEPLAFAWLQTTFDKQNPIMEQVMDFLLDLLALA